MTGDLRPLVRSDLAKGIALQAQPGDGDAGDGFRHDTFSGPAAGTVPASRLASSRTRFNRRTIVFRLVPIRVAISSWVMSSMK